MRGFSSTDDQPESSALRFFDSVCVLFVFGDICLFIGLFLLLSPDKRLQKITQ